MTVAEWKHAKVDLHKRPAIFVIHKDYIHFFLTTILKYIENDKEFTITSFTLFFGT